jgi:hypothetical protein
MAVSTSGSMGLGVTSGCSASTSPWLKRPVCPYPRLPRGRVEPWRRLSFALRPSATAAPTPRRPTLGSGLQAFGVRVDAVQQPEQAEPHHQSDVPVVVLECGVCPELGHDGEPLRAEPLREQTPVVRCGRRIQLATAIRCIESTSRPSASATAIAAARIESPLNRGRSALAGGLSVRHNSSDRLNGPACPRGS